MSKLSLMYIIFVMCAPSTKTPKGRMARKERGEKEHGPHAYPVEAGGRLRCCSSSATKSALRTQPTSLSPNAASRRRRSVTESADRSSTPALCGCCPRAVGAGRPGGARGALRIGCAGAAARAAGAAPAPPCFNHGKFAAAFAVCGACSTGDSAGFGGGGGGARPESARSRC